MSVSESCRFCGGKRLLSVNAKCGDLFRGKMPGKSWSNGYNFVPGLMENGDGDYVAFDVCLGCQRVQKDLFEFKPNKNTWPLEKKIEDLRERTNKLLQTMASSWTVDAVVSELANVDRCLVGLVRDLEDANKEISNAT